MEKRELGKTGMTVSVLGFGGAEIGFEGASSETVDKLLGSAIDSGLNCIDTAECYSDSEEKIGRALAHRRNDFYLFTKCGHASGFSEPDWNPAMLAKQIDRSLQRLQTDTLDLVQLHSCGKDLLEQGDVIAVLQKAREAGKTRFIGYSGDRENALYAVECGAFDTLQTSVNIADQEPIHLFLPKALERGIGVIAKRPVANVAWRNGANPPENDYAKPYWERLQKLNYEFLAGTDAVSIALRFALAQPAVATAIVGTKNPDRWHSNAALLDSGPLPAEQIAAIHARWHEISQPDWVGLS